MKERNTYNLSPFDNEKDGGSDNYTIPGRLPKVLLRLEGLKAELRELNVILVDTNRKDDGISIERRLIINQAASALMDGTGAFEELEDIGEMIRRCIRILDEGKDEMESNVADNDLLSNEDKSDEDLGGGDDFSPTLTRQRRTHRQRYPYGMRNSCRSLLRTRNEMVDD